MSQGLKTTCSYCGVGCGVIVHKTPAGLQIEGDPDHPANRGQLCSKGMNLHYTVMDRRDRLLFPEMRSHRAAPRVRVGWVQAIRRAAGVFRSLVKNYGPDSVGFYVSGQLLTEEYYIINKLCKGFLGTNNIDTNSRLCMSSAVVGYKKALGEDSVPVTYEDIDLADVFFIAGANPAWCHPILFRRIEERKAAYPNAKIIIVDPRRTQSCEGADLHLQILPGTDTALFHAIARLLIENEQIDRTFIREHTNGFDALREKVFERANQEYAAICGVPSGDIELAARWIGEARGFLSLWAMGLNQSTVGVNKNTALLNLSLITGKIGKPGNGPLSLTGQPNAMGGREVGGLCNLLPAHRDLTNPDHRKEVADFWGVKSIRDKPGLSATEMFESLRSGKMKAIWIVCTNPTVSLPDARLVEEGLKNAKFVVVQDISRNAQTIEFADLVLPAASWLEKTGTMTNSDRRVTLVDKLVDAPGEALADTEIIRRFAHAMGFEKYFEYENEESVFLEHARLTTGTNIDITGVDYALLRDKRAIQWPLPHKGHPGTPRLFEDSKFYTSDSRARLHAPPIEDTAEKSSPEYPLILTTGRIRDQWHTMTRTGKVSKLRDHIPEPYLEIHPVDADMRGISENDLVEVMGPRGDVRARARVTTNIRQGVVFLPMHWGRKGKGDLSRANNLTNRQFDPESKQPGFKTSAVQVQKFKKSPEKIVIVGAGAAAFGFIQEYRKQNTTDEILVFSAEPDAFYNRILLPEVVSDESTFESLDKRKYLENLSFKLVSGRSIVSIDRKNKSAQDDTGESHSYDRLILATGSRPFVPSGIKSPDVTSGVFTLRKRADAEQIQAYCGSDSRVVILGAGLLGLELAAALLKRGSRVSVVHRSDRIMNRQLDSESSRILEEVLTERGVKFLLNDEIAVIGGSGSVQLVRLASGKILDCDALVFAVGTTPEIELPSLAGLQCASGVIVDQNLQTSDPNIYAIGEVAEHASGLYGTTLASEDQGQVLARRLAGDPFVSYTGSLSMNILKIGGLSAVSMGLTVVPMADAANYEEIVFFDRIRRLYKKCVVHCDRLVGAILIGDREEFALFKGLIESGRELGDERLSLLQGGGKKRTPMLGKLVCSCNAVGEENICNAVKSEATTANDVMRETSAGLGCGSCKPEVARLVSNSVQRLCAV
ncbi:MAG: molybdopterin-dependent oxidoreductase [Leptospirales bacterium]|nr:molybdopterin-dependent oxidoreductase [Leptospirales bacterium]